MLVALLCRRTAVAGLVALTFLAAPLSAQGPDPRDGFWIGAGLGAGLGGARCGICKDDLDGGASGYINLGGTPTQNIRLGAEGSLWKTSQENVGISTAALNGVVFWYPNPQGALWYLKGGLGLVAYRANDNDPDEEVEDDAITSRSLGGIFGAGYDLRVSRNVSITTYFNFVGSIFANLQSQGQQLTDASVTLIQFGIGLTIY